MENLQGGTLALEHHYHLDRQIDSFGLVTRYAATQDPFDHPVQITVYSGLVEAGADPACGESIKAAAQRASTLEAPGLSAAIDFGEIDQGIPFVIEETVPGTSLAAQLQTQGVFAPDDVLELLERLAALLEAAHEVRICHGNLKPEWILLPDDASSFGDARLSHFGLSPSMAQLVAMPQAILTTELVEAFPPECFDVAARDQKPPPDDAGDGSNAEPTPPHLTPEADQWALAALAYRLLVGVHPFFDDPVDASEGILRIKTEEAPSLAQMGVDEDIADVIDRALAREPGDRWPSIDAFSRALRRAVRGPEPADEARKSQETSDPSQPEASSNQQLEDRSSAESLGPRPSGYLLTAALAGLILTNLGWFFFTMAGEEPDEGTAATVAEEEIPGPDILPSGLQIKTSPSNAELFIIDGDSQELLGPTPHVITDSLFGDDDLELLLRHPGYHDQRLVLDETNVGQNLILQLIDLDDLEVVDP